MSYYPKGHHFNPNDDDVDDFDEHDPTPYGGGYDIALTFGRPLPPSDEICYNPSSSASSGSGRANYGGGKSGNVKRNDEGSVYGSGGHGSEYGPGHPRRNETDEEGYASGGRKTYGHSDHTYQREDNDDDKRNRYGRRHHDEDDDDGSRRNMYGRRNDGDDDRKSRYGRRNDNDDDDDNDGYRGRKKYGDDDDEDNDKPRRNQYQQHRGYDE